MFYIQVECGSTCFIDPTLTEEECVLKNRVSGACGHVTVVYLPSLDEVTAIKQSGCMEPDELMMVYYVMQTLHVYHVYVLYITY